MRRDLPKWQAVSIMLMLIFVAVTHGENVTVCIPYLPGSISDVEVLAALAAVEDVNGRECGLLDGDCPGVLQGLKSQNALLGCLG